MYFKDPLKKLVKTYKEAKGTTWKKMSINTDITF